MKPHHLLSLSLFAALGAAPALGRADAPGPDKGHVVPAAGRPEALFLQLSPEAKIDPARVHDIFKNGSSSAALKALAKDGTFRLTEDSRGGASILIDPRVLEGTLVRHESDRFSYSLRGTFKGAAVMSVVKLSATAESFASFTNPRWAQEQDFRVRMASTGSAKYQQPVAPLPSLMLNKDQMGAASRTIPLRAGEVNVLLHDHYGLFQVADAKGGRTDLTPDQLAQKINDHLSSFSPSQRAQVKTIVLRSCGSGALPPGNLNGLAQQTASAIANQKNGGDGRGFELVAHTGTVALDGPWLGKTREGTSVPTVPYTITWDDAKTDDPENTKDYHYGVSHGYYTLSSAPHGGAGGVSDATSPRMRVYHPLKAVVKNGKAVVDNQGNPVMRDLLTGKQVVASTAGTTRDDVIPDAPPAATSAAAKPAAQSGSRVPMTKGRLGRIVKNVKEPPRARSALEKATFRGPGASTKDAPRPAAEGGTRASSIPAAGASRNSSTSSTSSAGSVHSR